MARYPENIRRLIDIFSSFPTIGPKTAERVVLHILSHNQKFFDEFSSAIRNLKGKILRCSECNNFSDASPCNICSDPARESGTLCIVAKPQDVYAIEKTNLYRGKYSILGGTVDPLERITLESLNFEKILERVKKNSIREVILAFNPTIEGETTILAVQKQLLTLGIKITRLARGLPMGADIEYADEITLGDALKGRKEITKNNNVTKKIMGS